jgi:hypothetical protein
MSEKSRSLHVSFRLPATTAARLRAVAAEASLSPGQVARLLVQRALLADTQTERVAAELVELRSAVLAVADRLERFEEKFAQAVLVLLISAGQADEARAEQYVRDHLLDG